MFHPVPVEKPGHPCHFRGRKKGEVAMEERPAGRHVLRISPCVHMYECILMHIFRKICADVVSFWIILKSQKILNSLIPIIGVIKCTKSFTTNLVYK